MNTSRDSQAGFTLIETLVALTVLAVGSVTLLVGVERHAAGVRALSDRVIARWVAENAIAATTLGMEMQPEWSSALGIDWSVIKEARPLPRNDLQAITVRVAEQSGQKGATLVSLTGYLALPEGTQ